MLKDTTIVVLTIFSLYVCIGIVLQMLRDEKINRPQVYVFILCSGYLIGIVSGNIR